MSGLQPPDGTKEVIEGVTEAIKQRIGSPIIFGIVASWCFFNYKFLLVIFAEDPFKEKFKYIASSIDLAFWKPALTGLAVAVVLPTLEVPYRAFRAFCRNLELKAQLWVHRRTPMDAKDQAAAFADKDAEIAALHNEIVSLRAKAQNSEMSFVQKLNLHQDSISAACRRLLAHETTLKGDVLYGLILGRDANLQLRQSAATMLRNSGVTKDIVKFANFVDAQNFSNSSYVEINIHMLNGHMAFQEGGDFSFFLDMLISLEMLPRPSIVQSAFQSVPIGTESYKTVVDFFRMAASQN